MRTIIATLLTLLATSCSARVVYVKPGGKGDGSGWASPLATVQAGINAAGAVDELWIAAGTYHENVTLHPSVSLYGGFNGTETTRDQRNPTVNVSILDGSGVHQPVIALTDDAGNETVIDGLTIQNGYEQLIRPSNGGPYDYSVYGGGAIYAPTSAPTVNQCVVQGCGPFPQYDPGLEEGVIYCGGGAIITSNLIQNNSGGGVTAFGGTVIGNVLNNNSRGYGIDEVYMAEGNNLSTNRGGIYATMILDNVIEASALDGQGGWAAVAAQMVRGNWISGCKDGSVGDSQEVDGNWIIGNNSSGYGTGVEMALANGRIADNIIALNGPNGGAIYLQPSIDQICIVVNNTIVGNFRDISQSDPLHYNGAGIIWGGGLHDPFVNNIIAFNAKGISTRDAVTVDPDIRDNDVYGNTEGNYVNLPDVTGTNGNISADPQFVDYSHGSYHLQPTSPCIDTGDDSVVVAGDTDLEQAPRIVGPHVDMGAYESLSNLPFTFSQAVAAIRILGGLQAALPSDLQRLNVIGADTSANVIDIRDAARLVRKAAGLDANP